MLELKKPHPLRAGCKPFLYKIAGILVNGRNSPEARFEWQMTDDK
jgi:hypothetical protein